MAFSIPLGLQTLLPEDYTSNQDFIALMEKMQSLGLSIIELNIIHPEKTDTEKLKSFLASYGIRMTRFATGAATNALGLSLAAADEAARAKAVTYTKQYIDFAQQFEAGIILGFLKGGVAPDKQVARSQFTKSIGELKDYAEEKQTVVAIEATNRYETSVANGLDDTFELFGHFNNPYLHILADTFHMNIEEVSIPDSLRKYRNKYAFVHLSDNNRFLPGLGGFHFEEFLHDAATLDISGYVMEGNIKESLLDDLETAVVFLKPFLSEN